MLFSSISFIYYFLPVVFILYFSVPRKWKNIALLVSSLLFYFLGEPRYTVILIFSTVVDYIHSLIIDKYRGKNTAKIALVSSIIINLSILCFFKYSDFFIQNINTLFGTSIKLLHIPLPLGISFFTFQTMSYTIDVYRNNAKRQTNPLGLATYVCLFPQLIAGPIVRYSTIAKQIGNREHSFSNFAYGIKRFVIGLSKKVLIANALGELNIIATGSNTPSILFYWLGAIAFSLQVYFDFSGYSDMAIGLGRIFGFHFLENFNYPYISKSISEFWSRWHISLGTWFKDYVYIPLGGNRVSKAKWLRNIFIVWLLTGFWHGSSWNFIVWGLYFGVLIAFEKLFLKEALDKAPNALRHAYVVLAVIISFVIFSTDTMSDIWVHLKGMFGMLGIPAYSVESLYYLKSYSVVIVVAIVGATPLIKKTIQSASKNRVIKKSLDILEPICYIALLIVVTGYLVDSSFNPFLYFRF